MDRKSIRRWSIFTSKNTYDEHKITINNVFLKEKDRRVGLFPNEKVSNQVNIGKKIGDTNKNNIGNTLLDHMKDNIAKIINQNDLNGTKKHKPDFRNTDKRYDFMNDTLRMQKKPKDTPKDTWKTIELGAKNDANTVKDIEKKLAALDYFTGSANGTFDKNTKAAVEKFQKDNNLKCTGVVDKKTMDLLTAAYNLKINPKPTPKPNQTPTLDPDQVYSEASKSGWVDLGPESKNDIARVSKLQGKLKALGYDVWDNGIYDERTERAVYNFQTNNNLPPTGIVNKKTWDEIDLAYKKNYKSFDKFLQAIADHESYGGNYTVVNGGGYLGKYQMGEMALADAGFYYERKENGAFRVDGDNSFEGTWSKLAKGYGINSKKDFLNCKQGQEAAFKEFLKKQWSYIDSYTEHIGETKDGVKITASGLLAGAHLLGVGGIKQLYGGKKEYKEDKNGIPMDGNGTPITKYIKDMGGYDLTDLLGYNPDK